jgi:cytosol alanyl aminopeptidase
MLYSTAMKTSRLMRSTACSVALILVMACSVAAGETKAPDFRLPDTARPTRYQLDLTILPDEPVFQGTAIIGVELKERTETIWLNAKDLTISAITVTSGGASAASRWRTTDEMLAVLLAHPAGPGHVDLEIHYTGKLDEKSNVGAYRRKAGNDWYAFTSFTAIDARRAFPCFDEPAYKAPWDVVLHVKRDQVAVANAPEISTTDEPDGMKRVAFKTTQPLPSEIVAFAVGPFEVVDAGVAGEKKIPVRIITPRGRAVEATAARAATPQILAWLEQYTGIPYPWDKLDHIAVLATPFGATENPGLITYDDRLLLADPQQDTQRRQQFMRSVMTHEIAHQWFGNLVTQAWWDDVWLSEGFATWLETKISDLERPEFERGLTATDTRDAMLDSDSAKGRPVRVPAGSRDDLGPVTVYDLIIYNKGASILKMLEDWLGPEVFQRALHRYLIDHQFGDATSADLVKAIQQESGVDVGPVLFGFLDRPGAPVLRFSMAPGEPGPKLEIEQDGNPWAVPVCIHQPGAARRCEVVSSTHGEIQLTSLPIWIWTNAYGSGYYRSSLSAEMWDAVVGSGYRLLEEPEQLALAADLQALTNRGQVPAAETMKILPQLGRDPNARVQAEVRRIEGQLAIVAPEADRTRYTDWLKKAMRVDPPAAQQGASVEQFLREKASVSAGGDSKP